MDMLFLASLCGGEKILFHLEYHKMRILIMYLTCFRKFLNSPLEYKTLTKIVYRKKEK